MAGQWPGLLILSLARSSSGALPSWPALSGNQSRFGAQVEFGFGLAGPALQDIEHGDAHVRALGVAGGLVSGVGKMLGIAAPLLTGAITFLDGPIGEAVMTFAEVILDVGIDMLTPKGQHVADGLRTDPKFKKEMAHGTVADLLGMLGIQDKDFSEEQHKKAIESIQKQMGDDPEDFGNWVNWQGHGMHKKYIGKNTMPKMKRHIEETSRLYEELGQVVRLEGATMPWMTSALLGMASLASLGCSLAIATRMWRQTEHLPETLLDDTTMLQE